MANARAGSQNGIARRAGLSGLAVPMAGLRAHLGTIALPGWAIAATLALLAVSIAVGVAAAWTRGPWMDEFWTLWATDPNVPWGQALRQRWLTDVHPPAFYMVSRLLGEVLGNDVAIRRFQNLLPLAGLIAALAYAARYWKNAGRFLLTYTVLAFSSFFMTGYFPEYRSYFAQFCCGVVFYGCGYALLSGDRILTPGDRVRSAWVLLLMSVLLVNLHFVTAVIALISLGGMAITAWMFGQRRLITAFCAMAAVAAVPLAVTVAFQAHYLVAESGGQFWIKAGLASSVRAIVISIGKGMGCNIVAFGLAGWMILQRSRAWPWFGATPHQAGARVATGESWEATIGLAFLGSALAGFCFFLVISLQTPIVTDRYFVLCSAAIVCGVAILVKDIVFERRLAFVMLLVNAAVFLAFVGDKLILEPRWNASAALVSAQVAKCPSTTVDAFKFPYAGSLPNEWTVLGAAHAYLGARFGFHVQMVTAETYQRFDPGQRCPRILWTEHVPWWTMSATDRDTVVLRAMQKALGVAPRKGGIVLRTNTGAVIINPDGMRAP
jgi:hypothetical protein